MLLEAMAARRRALSDAAAFLSRQVSSAARRPCPRASEGFTSAARTIKGSAKVASLGWRAPAARWFSASSSPPPGAIRAPVDQITYINRKDMETDTYISGNQFMNEKDLFKKMVVNPLLKDKVPQDLVALGKIRAFVVSCLGIAYENHQHGISVAVSFIEENMEVSLRYNEVRLKEAWGYRLDPAKGITMDNTFSTLAKRIDSMIRKVFPGIKYPFCFADLIDKMNGLQTIESRKVKAPPLTKDTELHLIHHASLFSTEDYIRFMTEMDILFKYKLPLFMDDPQVCALRKAVFEKVAKLFGYDGLPWLMSIGKHRFLEECYEFSEKARQSRAPSIHDAEDRKRYSVSCGITAMRTTGGLAAAVKSYLAVPAAADCKRLALKQISLQRDVLFHLYQEILQVLEVLACMPYTREDVAEAVRAVLPLTAVEIQSELFKHGWFNETKMTTFRSVSPFSLRHGRPTLLTDYDKRIEGSNLYKPFADASQGEYVRMVYEEITAYSCNTPEELEAADEELENLQD